MQILHGMVGKDFAFQQSRPLRVQARLGRERGTVLVE